jgi:hypothetical protein
MTKLQSVTKADHPLPVVSKLLRRFAHRYNDSGIGHWLPLIFATKINIWERFLHNFKQGILPNFLLKDKKQPIKNNRNQFPVATAARILVTTFVIAALFTAVRKRKKSAGKS